MFSYVLNITPWCHKIINKIMLTSMFDLSVLDACTSESNPAKSCLAILKNKPNAASGKYCIKLQTQNIQVK